MTPGTESLIGIISVVCVFGLPALIVWIVYYFDKREKELYHSSLHKLIDSGQEMTPELLQSIPGFKKENPDKNDIRTGCITSGVGIGIALLGYVGLEAPAISGIGLFLFAIGLGFLSYGLYSKDKASTLRD